MPYSNFPGGYAVLFALFLALALIAGNIRVVQQSRACVVELLGAFHAAGVSPTVPAIVPTSALIWSNIPLRLS